MGISPNYQKAQLSKAQLSKPNYQKTLLAKINPRKKAKVISISIPISDSRMREVDEAGSVSAVTEDGERPRPRSQPRSAAALSLAAPRSPLSLFSFSPRQTEERMKSDWGFERGGRTAERFTEFGKSLITSLSELAPPPEAGSRNLGITFLTNAVYSIYSDRTQNVGYREMS